MFGGRKLFCFVFLAQAAASQAGDFWESTAGHKLRQEGLQLHREGQYLRAAELYRQGYDLSMAQGSRASAVRFLNNLASSYFGMFRFREAMEQYQQAERIATAIGDRETTTTIKLNIASMYIEMGATGEAIRYARDALTSKDSPKDPLYRAMTLHTLGLAWSRRGDMREAENLLIKAGEAADIAGNISFKAKLWDRLGYEHLLHSELPRAEEALVEAYRLRTLFKDPEVCLSYAHLGALRLRQRNYRAAVFWLDQAVTAAEGGTPLVPLWYVYFQRAQARLAQSQLRAAVADFRAALDATRRWRVDIVPGDSVRIGSEVSLHELYAGFLRACSRLLAEDHDPKLVHEMFQVAEESHSWSLRQGLRDKFGADAGVPAEYLELLARYRSALAKGKAAEDVSARLGELEARAGIRAGSYRDTGVSSTVKFAQGRLRDGTALASFHLGETESYLWLITPSAVSLRLLPPRTSIAAEAGQFREAVMTGAPDSVDKGRALYATLFGPVSPLLPRVRQLLIVPDDALYEIPFAALVTSLAGRPPVYMVERFVTQVLPGAILGLSPASRPNNSTFLGVADPVYNTADPRWQNRYRSRFFTLFPAVLAAADPALPRLPGSAREAAVCARAWSGGVTGARLLTGLDASRSGVLDAVGRGPAAVHFSVHVTQPEGHPEDGSIALSLEPDGTTGVLSPADISALKLNVSLVVISACNSGRGRILPSAGLLGLTRAWMLAGARSVVASLWPVPDDSGGLFAHFYAEFRPRLDSPSKWDAAFALRKAQLECLRAGSWRAEPRYWAAFFAMGRE